MDSEQPVEQVKAEPVAWMYEHPTWPKCVYLEKQDMSRLSAAMVETPLYATPQPAAVDGLVELLTTIRKTIADSDHWWMECPDRGGFDLKAIDAALAQIERKPDAE